ncbi:uncharacterized protein L969DRAFT_45737 [Mixia osmundae IAM 14324]|uniref:DUF1772 domain-containing protein n=1 Tax=Mixia osmundae (strain CBS 9802 / IAM 14324 / JCM 22182 / KY 12970) TaxID=764103 RepID=G7DYA5_MIXOS|nr:uncharacterized protein L969DRAFT_45737 [Mixia osmundae IAM 14324]KEI41467.1 hypothetical protein L969DRAFT_45737 [Mixia osmundae IAM 14324]GAA95565.1 hypothetical protein E5Q_02220 [Mixia osmundae IAM 14324]
MSGYDKARISLDVARAIGTLGAGLGAGLMFATPIFTTNVAFGVTTMSPRDRLGYWSKLFDIGAVVVPVQASITILSLGTAAYLAENNNDKPLGNRRKILLASAAVVQALVLVWTRGVMIPSTIHPLKAIEARQAKDGDDKSGSDAFIIKWNQQHLVRVLLVGTTFALSVLELVTQ